LRILERQLGGWLDRLQVARPLKFAAQATLERSDDIILFRCT
jgi:hypothetical protein